MRASVPDQDGRASHGASKLSPPSGDHPSRGSMLETMPDFRDVIHRVVGAMDETNIPERYVPFAYIAERSGLPLVRASAVVRLLANLGYAEFARGLMTDDGEMRGSGYALNAKGFGLLDRIEAIAIDARQRRDAEERPDPKDESAGLEQASPDPSPNTSSGHQGGGTGIFDAVLDTVDPRMGGQQ
jgi:hypothetical protein